MYYKAKNNKILTGLSVLCCSSVLLLGGCATTGAGATKSSEIDPFEDFNRSIFSFNKVIDEYIAEPVVDAYNWVTPHFVRTGIGNFFSNLKDINVVLNDVLQGKFEQGAEDMGRFLLNSTLGLGGFLDPATDAGLVKHVEDFDQTFAVWGIPQGPYLILPVLGPITSRGVPGGILDTAANPASYVGAPIQLLDLLNQRANADSSLKIAEEAALDPYVFIRESFLQRRDYLISDGKSSAHDPMNDEATLEDESKKRVTVILGADKSGFQHAADHFSNTEKSFDGANENLKNASDKLEQKLTAQPN